MNIATIESELLRLSAEERAKLIDVLWNSFSEPEIRAREAAWAIESEWRIDAFDAGALPARNAEDVFADLKKNFRK